VLGDLDHDAAGLLVLKAACRFLRGDGTRREVDSQPPIGREPVELCKAQSQSGVLQLHS